MNMQIGAVLGIAVLLAGCGSTAVVETPSETPTASPGVSVPDSKSATKPSPITNAEPAPVKTVAPADDRASAPLTYPEIGTLVSAQAGDLMCYATVRDRQGQEVQVGATYEVCDRQDELVDETVRFIYSEENVADCQSAEPCGRTRQETLISDAVMLGNSWQVLSNGDWTVTVGQIDSWDGVNNSGGLTYYGCDADGNCLSLDEGFVVCRNGVCNWSWANGDYSYTISSELTETGDGPTTLLAWQGSTEILRAENMETIASSED